jgi:hypothetical protein
LFFLILNLNAFAQSVPEAFSYSAIARNSSGLPLSSTNLGIQISILKTSANGNMIYSENHVVNTDSFGLFNLSIGMGSIQSGNFSQIDWGADNYFIQVGMDVNGGTNFLTMGTTQLISVPYALYAKNAGSVNNPNVFTHYIGESYGGGIIFHLFRDSAGAEHGLIVAKEDIIRGTFWDSTGACLSNNCYDVRSAQSTWDGFTNTAEIILAIGSNNNAAAYCYNYRGGGFSDWYLPALQELNLLWNNLYQVNRSLNNSGSQEVDFNVYWSSTQVIGGLGAWNFTFMTGASSYWDKTTNYSVRAIRAF